MYDELPLRFRAKEALSLWLQEYRWACFATFTFKDYVPFPGVVLDRVERFLWQQTGPELQFRGAFLASEQHKSGSFHAHGLLSFRAKQSGHYFRLLHARWLRRYGFNRFESPRYGTASAYYCAKYLTKELSDWRVVGDWTPVV